MGERSKDQRPQTSRAEVRRRRAQLRGSQRAAGLRPKAKPTGTNHLSPYQDAEQEQEARTQTVVEKVGQMRAQLPGLLRRLARIPDPRNPKTITHKLTVLMVYGILAFVLQMASRREVIER